MVGEGVVTVKMVFSHQIRLIVVVGFYELASWLALADSWRHPPPLQPATVT